MIVDRRQPTGHNAGRRSVMPRWETQTARSDMATVNGSLDRIVDAQAVVQGYTATCNRLQQGLARGRMPTDTQEEFLGGVEMALEIVNESL